MNKLSSTQWCEISRRIFASWGAPTDTADCVAHSLVGSDMAGISSHGVLRIPAYYDFWRKGWLKPAARAQVTKESSATLNMEGNWGFGQPAMHLGLDLAIAKSRLQGIAGVGLSHCGHTGRLGEYAEKAAEAGVLAVVAVSGGPPGGLVVPYGGSQRVLGTNPIAAGVPAGQCPPFIMDFATSIIAAGKIEYSLHKNQPIPEGWALDSTGHPATTIGAFQDGGGLLPFGGHKGYAIAMLIELLCGGVTGAGLSERPDHIPTQGLGGNACFAIVIDIAHFIDLAQFRDSVDAFFGRLKRSRPAPGSPGVLIPGEPAAQQRAIRTREGFSVEDTTWEKIVAIAHAHDVTLEDIP
jgi:LDH2 family malate/lactate/ureidoglycolate dehydrogenase